MPHLREPKGSNEAFFFLFGDTQKIRALLFITISTMRFVTLAVASLVASTVGAFDVPSLTPDNYDSLTEGKTVFLKFFAPWVRVYQ
jgi:hypothetical protein